MKKIHCLLLVLCLCCFTYRAAASHILGGEMNYKFVSESGGIQTYKITLILYADCSSNRSGTGYYALHTATPTIRLFRGFELVSTINLSRSGTSTEITQLCNDEESTCSGLNNPIPGSRTFEYSGNIQIPAKDANWRILFLGNLGATTAARSPLIQNMDFATAGSIMALEATLNNLNGPNDNTAFTAAPNPFFCVHKLQSYSFSAANPDNDFLKYKLIAAKRPDADPSMMSDLSYLPPFTVSNPLPGTSQNFSFSQANGSLRFLPDQMKNALVVCEIEEYRNGVKVGSSMREITFIMLANCTNDMPLTTLDGVENATLTIEDANPVLNVCYGSKGLVKFSAHASDPNGDNITVLQTGVPADAVFTVTGDGTPTPVVHFTWDVSGLLPGDYFFYVTFADDGCPLTIINTQVYTIRVAPYDGEFDLNVFGPCADMVNGKAWIMPANGDHQLYKYVWTDNTGTILQTTESSTGDTLNNLGQGTYTVQVTTPEGCKKDIVFDISATSAPPIVQLPPDTTLCNDLLLEIRTNVSDFTEYNWSTGATGCCIDIALPGTYTLKASNPCGTSEDFIRVDYMTCNFCIFVPNAFSPNGDGINDDFKVREACQLRKYSIRVFNRWGNLVFNSNKTEQGWDGHYRNAPAEVGDYSYILEATPVDESRGNIKLKGNITLIR